MKKLPKKIRMIFSVLFIVVGIGLSGYLFIEYLDINRQSARIKELQAQQQEVLDEKKQLEKEIGLLDNNNYVTRYARKNYVFTKDGEKVTTIPGKK